MTRPDIFPSHAAPSNSLLMRQPDLFTPVVGDFAVRDQQDLMERPFFSLSKKRRTKPIEYRVGENYVRVTGAPEFGIATIYDADILIWVASQLAEAKDRGLPTSRFFHVAPYDILRFIHRGVSGKDYREFKAALDRLQSTAVTTSIRQQDRKKHHQFSWINEWGEITTKSGKSMGIEFIIPDWLYDGILNNKLILTIDEEYFDVTGGVERWLYRVLRKHAGHQSWGWSFTFRTLYIKSGSADRFSNFAIALRTIAANQSIPKHWLKVGRNDDGQEVLSATRRTVLPYYHEGYEKE